MADTHEDALDSLTKIQGSVKKLKEFYEANAVLIPQGMTKLQALHLVFPELKPIVTSNLTDDDPYIMLTLNGEGPITHEWLDSPFRKEGQ